MKETKKGNLIYVKNIRYGLNDIIGSKKLKTLELTLKNELKKLKLKTELLLRNYSGDILL